MADKLHQLATQEGIQVVYLSIPKICGYEGMYIERDGNPFIFLNRSLLYNEPLLRCVFAEELGHHFTSVGDAICKPYYSYTKRLEISRTEHRAWSWAAKFLIPLEKLLLAIKIGITSLFDLAEHFIVTEEMIKFRLKMTDIKSEKANPRS